MLNTVVAIDVSKKAREIYILEFTQMNTTSRTLLVQTGALCTCSSRHRRCVLVVFVYCI